MGIADNLFKTLSPELPSRLWYELDVVPMVFENGDEYREFAQSDLRVDEQADSMARKCIMYAVEIL